METDPLRDEIIETVRSHTESSYAGYRSRNHEIEVLKAKISVLEHQIGWLRAENIGLRAELRRAGVQSITDIPVVR